jgi:hypothetical protein
MTQDDRGGPAPNTDSQAGQFTENRGVTMDPTFVVTPVPSLPIEVATPAEPAVAAPDTQAATPKD